MKYAVVFGLVATSLCGLARASSGFEAEMKEVIAKEERASTFEEVVAVAEAFAQIGKDHPGKWQALYWAAFDYSQCWVFGQTTENGFYLDLAQAYFERAVAAYPNRSARDEAEFQVLQALIYGLKSYYYRKENRFPVAQVFKDISDTALVRAERANPDNPRVRMMRSIDTFNNPATRAQGIEAMKTALEVYAGYRLDSPIAPNWGKSFIDYRLNMVKQKQGKD